MTDDEDLARLHVAADKIEMIEVLALYQQLLDSRELRRLREVFTEDADVAYPGMVDQVGLESDTIEGVDAIIGWLERSLVDAVTVHYMTNHVFQALTRDEARVRSYLRSYIITTDLRRTSPGTSGVYETQFRRTPQGWRISRLELVHYYLPATLEFLAGLRDADDTSAL